MKHYHEEVKDLHKHDGGAGMQHHHDHVKEHLKKHDGHDGTQHHHEEVAKLCGGGMARGKK